MSVLRNVWADLVEKRLWPVAVALVVALVAVPVVLGRSAAPVAPAAPAASAAAPVAAAPATEVVALRTGPTRARPGAPARDPFAATSRRARTASAPAATASASTAASGPDRGAVAAGSAAGGPSAGAGGAASGASSPSSAAIVPGASSVTMPPASSAPGVAGAPRTAAPPAAGYRVDVRFGPAADTALRRDLTRLAVLGAPDAPVLIYLGVREGGRTVLFEVADEGVAVTGDGRCLPSPRDCQTLELAKGDAQFLDVPAAGGIVQYELGVEKIARKRATTAARAARSRARFSKDGRRTLRKVIAAGRVYVGRYEYSQRRGVVIAHAPEKPGN